MKKDDSIARSFMLLCLGAAGLVVATQWQTTASTVATQFQRSRQQLTSLPELQRPATRQQLTSKPPKSDVRLVVDLSDRLVRIYKGAKLQSSYPVAIGQAGWETPTGKFQILEMQKNPVWQHPITEELITTGPENPLGVRWISFWSDGQNQIGFHGTNQEELIGQAVSHGCLRMRNPDITALFAQVHLGTPITVQP